MSNKIKILQIGPLSNVGGINIHINRLCKLLTINNNKYIFSFIDESPKQYSSGNQYNIRRINDFKKYLTLIREANLVHIHSGQYLFRLMHMIVLKLYNKKFIVTIHSFRVKNIRRYIIIRLLKNAEKVICVNENIKSILMNINTKILVKEAFIPPFINEEPKLPRAIYKKILTEKLNKTIICVNASKLTDYKGKELYGLDQCIELAQLFKKNKLPFLIVFVIGTVQGNDKIYKNSMKKIKNHNLAKYIWVIPFSVSFVRLIMESSLVLRPTLTDGDALTVREALALKKHVIASDIITRPKGTITYKIGDVLDLYTKILLLDFKNKKSSDKFNLFEDRKYLIQYYNKIYSL